MEEREFKEKLTPEQYRIMRQKGTEAPHTGKYWDHDETGIYTCAACGNILFLSLNKIEAERGWPAFTKPANTRTVRSAQDGGRTEIVCKKCGSHLGYLVEDGKKHYEINSLALEFLELPDIEWEAEDDDGESKESQQVPQNTSNARTISLTIGGLTIGAVVGAGAMWYGAPAPMCTPTDAQTAALSAPAATNTAPVTPPAPDGVKKPPVSPSPVIVATPTSTPPSASSTPAATSTDGTGIPATSTTP